VLSGSSPIQPESSPAWKWLSPEDSLPAKLREHVKDKWELAMDGEIESLMKNQT